MSTEPFTYDGPCPLGHDAKWHAVPNQPVPLDGLEGRLRQFVAGAHAKKAQTEARLAWPDEFDYDLRAFQKSGIDDPYGMGLI